MTVSNGRGSSFGVPFLRSRPLKTLSPGLFMTIHLPFHSVLSPPTKSSVTVDTCLPQIRVSHYDHSSQFVFEVSIGKTSPTPSTPWLCRLKVVSNQLPTNTPVIEGSWEICLSTFTFVGRQFNHTRRYYSGSRLPTPCMYQSTLRVVDTVHSGISDVYNIFTLFCTIYYKDFSCPSFTFTVHDWGLRCTYLLSDVYIWRKEERVCTTRRTKKDKSN